MLALVRGLRLVIHLLVGLGLAALIHLDVTRRLSRERLMHWWCCTVLDVLSIDLRVTGRTHPGARFTVANHVSWIDMMLIGACEPTRFVSKSEVARWPIAGWLANAAGTFYIRRGKGGAAPLIERLIPHLSSGGSVVIFPEGTTTDGQQVKPFFPRLFAAALEAQCPVQPLAIRYLPDAEGQNVAPFIGDDDLFSHILRVLRAPEIRAELVYCAPLLPGERSREQIAVAAQAAVERALGAPLRERLSAPAYAAA